MEKNPNKKRRVKVKRMNLEVGLLRIMVFWNRRKEGSDLCEIGDGSDGGKGFMRVFCFLCVAVKMAEIEAELIVISEEEEENGSISGRRRFGFDWNGVRVKT